LDKVALVTGAGGGIGRAICERLSADGFHVVGADVMDAFEASWNGLAIKCDVGSVEDLEKMFSTFHRLDLVVNNAAIAVYKKLVETSVEDWDTTFAINVRACFLTTRLSVELLEAVQGSVVNVSSVHASATSAGVAAYASSKGAVEALTRAAAVELAPRGIRVNAVMPGAVDTPMLRRGLSRLRRGLAREHLAEGSAEDDKVMELGARHPMGRVATPAEVAAAVSFLASSDAGFITGATIPVDGGTLAKLSTE